MCGRYSLYPDESEEIQKIVNSINLRYGPGAVKTGEIFPTNIAPVLLAKDNTIDAAPLIWGFPGFQGRGVLINARSETAAEKRTFAKPLAVSRCVVPTTGFFEWNRQKTKYRFCGQGNPALYLAGLYNTYQGVERYVILTKAANASVQEIHDRMPVVLRADAVERWLLAELPDAVR